MHKNSYFPEPLRQIDRTSVLWRGRKLAYFGGCDYLRLSSHANVLRAAQNALHRHGLNVAASRRTTGNHPLYEELETATRNFFGAESAVLVSCGYLTNIAVAQGLRGKFTRVYLDQQAHFSLRDALKFLNCPHTEFRRRDPADLRKKVPPAKNRQRIAVLTDGMFAQDGSRAPLAAYREILGVHGTLWVDDAHAGGILGRNGRGTAEEFGLDRRNLIQTVTFSKAFGAYGGAILCSRSLAAAIIAQSSVLLGNTPLPLPLAAAALQGLELCRTQPSRRQKLFHNIETFWTELGHSPSTLSPIIAATAKNPELLKRRLLQAGIHPPFIEYGPATQRYFRFALSSEHSPAQIKKLARTLATSRNNPKIDLQFPGL